MLISQPDIVPSEEYSIKRFSEVLETAVEDAEASPQEKLIALRAKLVIAERLYADMQSRRKNAATAEERENAPRIVQLRAAEARIDHFQMLILRTERRVLQTRNASPKNSRLQRSNPSQDRRVKGR